MLGVLTLAFVSLFSAQQPALRIVVIDGEDAVNVIQQKTATRPVVEVRDRNNLPVPGALVTFSIEGGKAASFGGASTLTVATNAAGQAAVTSLTPSAAGAFQIQVQAAFQGQLATATIAQTNVVTAAQAAAAGATAGGSGGGLSATTIGIAGAAVAGSAVAATQITRKEDGPQTFSGNFSGQLTSTILSRLGTCVITRAIEASMQVVLDSTEPIRGHAEIEGTDTVVAATCPASVTGRVRERIEELSGRPASFGFSVTRMGTMPDPLDGGTINGTNTIVLEASLANDVISGQLKFNGHSTKSGEFSNTESSTATFQVSLRKTQ